MDANRKISVLLVSYNHEKYINEAIDSILFQRVGEPYEIVVADDCSNDSTMDIIRQYEGLNPDIFRVVKQGPNLGITKNYQRGFGACNGEYIAVLEGDDYWTSSHKLQRCVDFLREHRECAMVFNRCVVYDEASKRWDPRLWHCEAPYQLFNVADLAKDNLIGNFSTCVYRADIIKKLPQSLYELKVYDWMFNICMAQEGLIGYIPDIMSVYRQHELGTWAQKDDIEKVKDVISQIDLYNDYLEGKYNDEFEEHKSRLKVYLRSLIRANTGSKLSPVKSFLKNWTPPVFKSAIKLFLPPRVTEFIANKK